MTATPADLQLKRPAEVVPTATVRAPLPDRGRWVLSFVFLGLPILFIAMVAYGFVSTR